ncbi:MAG: thymidine phosphorylase [Gemmatimonadetes bacterium]|nr:thymidine phosphorylase [Gemmatimonadota bacterium]
MNPIELIELKKRGQPIPTADIDAWVRAVSRQEIPDYQVSALLMAIYFRGMTSEETAAYTRAIRDSGCVLDLSALGPKTVDKHSTGGVGDKTSLALAPAVAACGVPVPMLSGRGLGHTGGTLDKLESIPGFRADLSIDQFKSVVARAGCAIVGQTSDLAPADRVLYALRDVTATVDSLPLIVGSIVGKKLAAGPAGLVYDVKVGRGAFMRQLADARSLARALVDVTRAAGRSSVALITAMDAPLGAAIGNALEVAEAIDLLHGAGPADLRELVVALGAEMLLLSDAAESRAAAELSITHALDSGDALEVFARFVEAQGGDPRVATDRALLPAGPVVVDLPVPQSGRIVEIDGRALGELAVDMGAGRKSVGDPIDPAVGLVLRVKPGEYADRGESLLRIYARDEAGAESARSRAAAAFTIGPDPVPPQPLLVDRID